MQVSNGLGAWMEAEIRQQPEVLARGAENYLPLLTEQLAGKSFDMVVLVARGSSDNAALYARYLIEVHLGIPVSLAAPSVITRFKSKMQFPKSLVIGISQSGAAPDVSEVIETLGAQGHHTLGISNTPDSRLVESAQTSLLLETGAEKSVAATKTFTATVLALHEVVRALGADLPEPVLPDKAWVENMREVAQEDSGAVVRCQPVFALGRGYSFSVAHECALKLMECALIPCKAYSSADFEHGPKALAGHGSAAIVFDGPKPHLVQQGCEILEVPAPLSDRPNIDTMFPLWDAVYAQWIALISARARGLDPDHARHLKKVTETV